MVIYAICNIYVRVRVSITFNTVVVPACYATMTGTYLSTTRKERKGGMRGEGTQMEVRSLNEGIGTTRCFIYLVIKHRQCTVDDGHRVSNKYVLYREQAGY